jgi:hypothetical protein
LIRVVSGRLLSICLYLGPAMLPPPEALVLTAIDPADHRQANNASAARIT